MLRQRLVDPSYYMDEPILRDKVRRRKGHHEFAADAIKSSKFLSTVGGMIPGIGIPLGYVLDKLGVKDGGRIQYNTMRPANRFTTMPVRYPGVRTHLMKEQQFTTMPVAPHLLYKKGGRVKRKAKPKTISKKK